MCRSVRGRARGTCPRSSSAGLACGRGRVRRPTPGGLPADRGPRRPPASAAAGAAARCRAATPAASAVAPAAPGRAGTGRPPLPVDDGRAGVRGPGPVGGPGRGVVGRWAADGGERAQRVRAAPADLARPGERGRWVAAGSSAWSGGPGGWPASWTSWAPTRCWAAAPPRRCCRAAAGPVGPGRCAADGGLRVPARPGRAPVPAVVDYADQDRLSTACLPKFCGHPRIGEGGRPGRKPLTCANTDSGCLERLVSVTRERCSSPPSDTPRTPAHLRRCERRTSPVYRPCGPPHARHPVTQAHLRGRCLRARAREHPHQTVRGDEPRPVRRPPRCARRTSAHFCSRLGRPSVRVTHWAAEPCQSANQRISVGNRRGWPELSSGTDCA